MKEAYDASGEGTCRKVAKWCACWSKLKKGRKCLESLESVRGGRARADGMVVSAETYKVGYGSGSSGRVVN